MTSLYNKIYNLFHQWLSTEEEDEENHIEWLNNNFWYYNGILYSKENFTILKFTGTSFTNSSSYHGNFSNSIVDWGEGIVESPSQLTHTYTDNTEHIIKIMNAPYSSQSCFRETPITSIAIPFGVTSIGNYCFTRCTNLRSITIPSSVTSLGSYCFTRTNLTSINIPSSVTSLSSYCFDTCTFLTSLNIPSSVTSIGSFCFSYCTNLTSVILNWTTSTSIPTYNSNWIYNSNSNLKFIIPQGTTSLYTAKSYPSDKLQEAAS